MEGLVVLAVFAVAAVLAWSLARGALQLRFALRSLRDWKENEE